MVFFLGGDCRTWAALKSPLAVQASAIYISLAPPPLPYRREMDDGSSPNRSLHQEKKARQSVPFFLVETAGLEPVTPCMSSKYSNQLS